MDWIHANVITLVVVALVVALLLTALIFSRRRNFGYGRTKGKAADPAEVRRQNPPD